MCGIAKASCPWNALEQFSDGWRYLGHSKWRDAWVFFFFFFCGPICKQFHDCKFTRGSDLAHPKSPTYMPHRAEYDEAASSFEGTTVQTRLIHRKTSAMMTE